MRSELLDQTLLLGGALWVSVALHGGLAVYAGVLEDDAPTRIEITLVSAVEARDEERRDDIAPALADGPPRLASARGAAAHEKESEELPWRQRLRRDEAQFDRSQAETEHRLALVHAADAASSEPPADPGTVRRCVLAGPADEVKAPILRDLGRLAPVLPGGLLPEPYLAGIGEMGWGRVAGRVTFDLALPAELLPIRLEDPDVLVAVGRTDARCFVRISVGPELFPLHLLGLPVREVDAEGVVRAAVVDVELDVNAEVRVMRVLEGEVSVAGGRLYGAHTLAPRMRDHQSIFRTLRALSAR